MTIETFLPLAGASLLLALAATALAAALAVACGAWDAWARLSDRQPAGSPVYVPAVLVLLAIGVALGDWTVPLAGAVAWANLAYVVRREVAALHRRAFVDAARLAGLAPGTIVRRHVIPHLGRPLGLQALFTLPQVLAADALRQLLEAASR